MMFADIPRAFKASQSPCSRMIKPQNAHYRPISSSASKNSAMAPTSRSSFVDFSPGFRFVFSTASFNLLTAILRVEGLLNLDRLSHETGGVGSHSLLDESGTWLGIEGGCTSSARWSWKKLTLCAAESHDAIGRCLYASVKSGAEGMNSPPASPMSLSSRISRQNRPPLE
jgi:hypothetical protein